MGVTYAKLLMTQRQLPSPNLTSSQVTAHKSQKPGAHCASHMELEGAQEVAVFLLSIPILLSLFQAAQLASAPPRPFYFAGLCFFQAAQLISASSRQLSLSASISHQSLLPLYAGEEGRRDLVNMVRFRDFLKHLWCLLPALKELP